MKFTAKDIAYNGIIAAIYVVLTLITYPFSYLPIQVRISEILVLLCFFRKDYAIGLTLGCAIANLFSSVNIMDALFGTIATLLSCVAVMFCKHLAISLIFPVVFNAFIVGAELYFFVGNNSFFAFVGLVAIGELIAMVLGWVFFFAFRKNAQFLKLIRAKQNVDFKF